LSLTGDFSVLGLAETISAYFFNGAAAADFGALDFLTEAALVLLLVTFADLKLLERSSDFIYIFDLINFF